MEKEEKREVINSTKGYTSSLVVHSLLILLGITPLATFNAPKFIEETPGMEVALGFPDEGQGHSEPSPGENTPGGPPPPTQTQNQPVREASSPPERSTDVAQNTKGDPILSSEASDAVEAAQVAEAKRKKAEQAQVEAERKRQSEIAAEAARKAEADRKAAEYANAKSKYGGLLQGKGTGRGNTGKAGNQGDPNGDPNAKNLEGIHTGGKGRIGGGLGNRGVVSEPKIEDNSQKTGRVVIKVCVNQTGSVSSAEYTQKGSTTNDATLISIARKNALKFKFTSGDVDTQCGTITYDFKVQ